MANLHLTLLTDLPGQQLSTCRFNERGGSVGRSPDCDWQLNDAERFISNKHIIISFVNDHFLVTDTSSNGTYVNDSAQPLGKGNSHHLQLQDIIKLGTLSIQVSEIDLSPAHVSSAPSAPPMPTASFNNEPSQMSSADSDLLDLVSGKSAAPSHEQADVMPGLDRSAKQPESASSGNLGLFDILSGDMPDTASNTGPSPFSPNNTPKEQPPVSAPQTSPFSSQERDNTIPDNWDLDEDDEPFTAPSSIQIDAPQVTDEEPQQDKPAIAAATPAETAPQVIEQQSPDSPDTSAQTRTTQTAPSDTNSNADDFFTLLYKKLGLPTEYMHTVDKAEFAEDLMQVLMTSTQGLMALLAGRSVLKQESRLSMTMIKPQSNNPIKFSLDPTDTLEMLLVKKKSGYLTAQAAYAEAMNDLQLHQMAFLSGLQASLEGILNELSPDTIDKEAQEKGRGLIDFKGHSRKWETFTNKQEKLQKQVKENLNDVLSKHFSAAYESYINSSKTNH